jgi:hypothetical protein
MIPHAAIGEEIDQAMTNGSIIPRLRDGRRRDDRIADNPIFIVPSL